MIKGVLSTVDLKLNQNRGIQAFRFSNQYMNNKNRIRMMIFNKTHLVLMEL